MPPYLSERSSAFTRQLSLRKLPSRAILQEGLGNLSSQELNRLVHEKLDEQEIDEGILKKVADMKLGVSTTDGVLLALQQVWLEEKGLSAAAVATAPEEGGDTDMEGGGEEKTASEGRPPLTKRIANDVAVAYELLLDQKRKEAFMKETENVKQLPSSPTAPAEEDPTLHRWHTGVTMKLETVKMPLVEAGEPVLFGQPVLPPSTVQSEDYFSRAAPGFIEPGLLESLKSENLRPQSMEGESRESQERRRRWYLGIQSKKDPVRVMTEVLSALQRGDMVRLLISACLVWITMVLVLSQEWKMLTPYRVQCRQINPPPSRCGPTIMFLQLYRVRNSLLEEHTIT